MKVIMQRGHVNVLMLVAVLISNTLFQSELGGPDSIFNALSFLLALAFLALNPRFHSQLSLFFAVPILCLMLSVLVNITTLHPGGFRSALVASVGYMLLMLRPLDLNIAYLRRLIFMYLFVCLVISIGFTMDYLDLLSISVLEFGGNPNFNINPNSACPFFLSCLMLSLTFMQLKTKWVFSIIYSVLILTTASRSGIMSSMLFWVLYLWLGMDNQSSVAVFRTRFMVVASLVSVVMLVAYVLPDVLGYVLYRFADVGVGIESSHGGGGRDEIWDAAFQLANASLASILFGTGPATTAELVGRGAHSSYVAAISSNGYLFMGFTLVAILALFRFHFKRSQGQFIISAISILFYGAAQEMLFSGVGSLWYTFMFLSLYYRSVVPMPQSAMSNCVVRRGGRVTIPGPLSSLRVQSRP